MTIVKNITTLAVSAILMAGAGQVALADDQDAEVETFSQNLVVVGNGKSYTELQNVGNAAMGVHLQYDAGTSGRVKSWTATPHIRSSVGAKAAIPGMSLFKKSKSYSVGNRPKTLDFYDFINFPVTALEQAAVGMCNDVAAGLKSKGQSLKQIFSANHKVDFIASVAFSVDASGLGKSIVESDDGGFPIEVTCKKWTGAAVPLAGTLKSQIEIKKATMKLQEVAALNGACMVKLTTAISTSQPGATVKYRYVHSSGAKSNVMTVKTAANSIAVVKHDWDIPNGPGQEFGWMRMDGVSPNFKSNQAQYRMTCKGGGVGGISSGTARPGTTVRAK